MEGLGALCKRSLIPANAYPKVLTTPIEALYRDDSSDSAAPFSAGGTLRTPGPSEADAAPRPGDVWAIEVSVSNKRWELPLIPESVERNFSMGSSLPEGVTGGAAGAAMTAGDIVKLADRPERTVGKR